MILQERLHKKLDALAARTSPSRKPTIAGASELAALKEALAAREAEAASLREQVSAASTFLLIAQSCLTKRSALQAQFFDSTCLSRQKARCLRRHGYR